MDKALASIGDIPDKSATPHMISTYWIMYSNKRRLYQTALQEVMKTKMLNESKFED